MLEYIPEAMLFTACCRISKFQARKDPKLPVADIPVDTKEAVCLVGKGHLCGSWVSEF